MAAVEAEAKQEPIAEPSGSSIDFSDYTHRVVSFLARNFYNLKYVALVLAFCINFMLLFYRVSTIPSTQNFRVSSYKYGRNHRFAGYIFG